MPEKLEASATTERISQREKERQLGAVGLTLANFQDRHKEIIDSSFNKAREKGEKLPGKNNERRNYAYLSRLESLIDKYGNEVEKKLWQASIKDDLLVEYDNITESYWQSKKQELRDNGYGNIELTEDYKHELFNKEREIQNESLEKWANYLGDEHSPYPLWFKIYAWDGMTKMGAYDKGKGIYATRNETTVAPYPNPDAEVLGGVFEVINRYYGNNEKEFYTEEGERNIQLEKIVQSGNFAKIYNAIEHDIAPIIEPPEKAEDVHGSWIEYSVGKEDDIARAARGTGWCVASPSVGRHYLEYGTYGQDNDWDEDEEWVDDEDYDYFDEWAKNNEYHVIDEDDEYRTWSSRPAVNRRNNYNDAKFILFHLEDSSTGKLSKNAVASIRLDPDGQVAEISGLKKGQALNDSLVNIVAEKVKTLPGGEKFLKAFADKQELIRLDHKMQNDEDLTKEELEFVYEINRPIHVLDTYNKYDPRISELKERYGLNYALDAGVDADNLASKLKLYDIVDNLDALIDHGASIDVDDLVSKLPPRRIVKDLDTLVNHGADIDIYKIIPKLSHDDIIENLEIILRHGVSVHEIIVESFEYVDDIIENIDILLKYGADINQLPRYFGIPGTIENLDFFASHGADISQLVSRFHLDDIIGIIDFLNEHGVDIYHLISKQHPDDIAKNLDVLISKGIDINQLASSLDSYEISRLSNALRAHGWQG